MGHQDNKRSTKSRRHSNNPASRSGQEDRLPTVVAFGSVRRQTILDSSDWDQMRPVPLQPHDTRSETLWPAWSTQAENAKDVIEGVESAPSNALGDSGRDFQLPPDPHFDPGRVLESTGYGASQQDTYKYTKRRRQYEIRGSSKDKYENDTGFSAGGLKNVDKDPRYREEFRYRDTDEVGSQFGNQQPTTGTSSWIDNMPGPYANCCHGYPRHRCPHSVCQRGSY